MVRKAPSSTSASVSPRATNGREAFIATVDAQLTAIEDRLRHDAQSALSSVDFADPDVGVDAIELNVAVGENALEVLKQVRDARERIRCKTYGVCEGCGADIALTRLQALPFTCDCFDCRKAREENDRTSTPVSSAQSNGEEEED